VLKLENHYKSSWEVSVANCLCREHLEFEYEPGFFPLKSGIKYTPDFVLGIPFGDKQVIIEPHGVMDQAQFEKFALFRQIYGHDYFLILLVKNEDIPYIRRDSYDDIWPIEFVLLLAKRLHERASKPQEDEEFAKL